MQKTVHIFNCSTHVSLYGLTYDAAGANLPQDSCKGKWQKFKTINILNTDPVLLSGLLPKDIIDKLDQDGYWLYEIKLIFNWIEK